MTCLLDLLAVLSFDPNLALNLNNSRVQYRPARNSDCHRGDQTIGSHPSRVLDQSKIRQT